MKTKYILRYKSAIERNHWDAWRNMHPYPADGSKVAASSEVGVGVCCVRLFGH